MSIELSQTHDDNEYADTASTGRFDDIFDSQYTGSGEMFGKYEKIVIGWMDFIDGTDDDNIDGGDDSSSESEEDSEEDSVIMSGLSNFNSTSEVSGNSEGEGLSDFDNKPKNSEMSEGGLSDFDNKPEDSKDSKDSEVSGNSEDSEVSGNSEESEVSGNSEESEDSEDSEDSTKDSKDSKDSKEGGLSDFNETQSVLLDFNYP